MVAINATAHLKNFKDFSNDLKRGILFRYSLELDPYSSGYQDKIVAAQAAIED